MTDAEQPRVNVIWEAQPGPQTALIACPVFEVFFGGARGGGKLSPLDSLVCTPRGFKRMGDIAIGDQVSDPVTGGCSTVVGIYPQGSMPIWRLTFDDGAALEVGADHLWAYRLANHHRPRSKASQQRAYASAELGASAPQSRWDGYRIGPTTELQAAFDAGHGVRIPLSESLAFTANGRTGAGEIEPYLVGLMLGDGACGTLRMSTCDDGIRDYLLAKGFRAHACELHTDGKSKSYAAVEKTGRALDQWLRNHGLRECCSYEKFVPAYVKTATIDYRLDVLRGLLDTDGTVDERGRVYFISTSQQLAEDVQWLARSLGGKARIRTRQTRYTHKDELKDGRPSWQVRIWHPKQSALFRLERKKVRCLDSWNGGAEITRELIGIEYIGEKEAQCIAVSSPYGLYVADDFIVTHNTDGMLGDWLSHQDLHEDKASGLMVRRTLRDLEDTIKRSKQIFIPLGAKFKEDSKVWTFPNKAEIKFRYLDNDSDADHYQGHSYCVAVGTRIQMADGTLKPIETIKAGEMVRTLEGPRRVLKTVQPYAAPCVSSLVRDASEAIVGQQIHPVWHPVLTSLGHTRGAWASWSQSKRHRVPVALCAQRSRATMPPVRVQSWVHPYSDEERCLSEPVQLGTMEVEYAGEALVADLCVEGANHYIGETGLVNKNTRVYVEEITQFPSPDPVMKLMATLRSGAGVPCGFRATGNPGGPGHNWVKARYIIPAPNGWEILKSEFKNPWTGTSITRERVFIPSNLRDNKYLGDEYVANLYLSGNVNLVRAWLAGDWSVIDGAFFPEWNLFRHVVRPFTIPATWLRFRSGDWGSAKPFSIGWWAVVGDDYPLPNSHIVPRGALIRYREWYGSNGQPNVGLGLTAEEVARGIVEREMDEPRDINGKMGINYGVLDPSAFAHSGGPSIAERMYDPPNKVLWQEADNARVPRGGAMGGWDQVRSRLIGTARRDEKNGEIDWATGDPMIYFFLTCTDSIRTLPALPHDPRRVEDVDTSAEDHCPDEIRYACMSRPYIKTTQQSKRPQVLSTVAEECTVSLDDIFQANERRLGRGGSIRKRI